MRTYTPANKTQKTNTRSVTTIQPHLPGNSKENTIQTQINLVTKSQINKHKPPFKQAIHPAKQIPNKLKST